MSEFGLELLLRNTAGGSMASVAYVNAKDEADARRIFWNHIDIRLPLALHGMSKTILATVEIVGVTPLPTPP